jgi:hypothetical protein
MTEKVEKIEEMETPMETPETADVSPEVTVTEESTTVSPTSRTREWMQKKYADKSWESDELLDEDVAAHLADTDERLSSYEESDSVMGDLMERDPEFALVINAMSKGMPFRVALRRYLGDILADEPVEGDPDWDAYRKASDEYLAEKKKTDEEIATRTANIAKSDEELEAFMDAQGWNEQEQSDFVEFLRTSLRTIGMGEISPQFLAMMRDAFMHDQDVEEAKEAGAIEARNEKITAKRIKESEATDGIPMGGGSSPIVEEAPEEDDFLGAAAKRYRNKEFK